MNDEERAAAGSAIDAAEELRTVIDCLRRLPFDEALCVADSALRQGVGRVDLADRRLRIIIEADSFEFHGTRHAAGAGRGRGSLQPIRGCGMDRPAVHLGGRHAAPRDRS